MPTFLWASLRACFAQESLYKPLPTAEILCAMKATYSKIKQRYCDKLGEQVLWDDFDAFVPVSAPPLSSDSVYQHVLAIASIQLRCTTNSLHQFKFFGMARVEPVQRA